MKRGFEWHLSTVDKLYNTIKSCETITQYNNAMLMLVRYSINRWNGAGIANILSHVQDYALVKGKIIYLDSLNNKTK